MCIEMQDWEIENTTDDDIIEWLLFEYGKKKQRRRLPEPLDHFDITFSHHPEFMSIIKIER